MMENKKILDTGDLDGFDKLDICGHGLCAEEIAFTWIPATRWDLLDIESSAVTHLAPEQVSTLAVAELETPQEGPGELMTYWFPV
ncbi:hypothetical protein Patl1_37575 [Pistacia atlantica]|nr:hypothetical protein Patl1_37575 [Pistacia atlantica]